MVNGIRRSRSSGHAWVYKSAKPSSKVKTTLGRSSSASRRSSAASSETTSWFSRRATCLANVVAGRSSSFAVPAPMRW